jgi:hypothetical protein
MYQADSVNNKLSFAGYTISEVVCCETIECVLLLLSVLQIIAIFKYIDLKMAYIWTLIGL